ncbi:SUKH-3 domain-containing protein [Brevibacillus laterosporus]|uniref:SUKH-3 domain-containing protein n=1 Tax=Brevibacillus laterosporus TaxID=1465 RepID=A0AAP3G808_BRELA|nr:SUKH-3 domain-containing protein [Brevibacillus laterosporus]MCR8980883.1 SUKH-3 domain-containing protein [Brevibacillus laterosporus]MCZ0808038.1 SUKH-3 domain-containing protein [Brevibacillus laterosporus]MCZ0826400.1 SUKH-3 domain-containing protein [Brevibacillus laterosporus]MCZ0852466.1 SUKH-3 domain-containing protein [Brevibacillus laterosporus]MED1666465.1 SUKH-3 domain-containing protein [Brevibacillus laterosporus]
MGFKEDNIEPSPYSLEVLEKFGGIKIKTHATGFSRFEYFTELVIDPKRGVVMPEEITEFEEVIGEKLTPLGFFPRSDLDIFVSETGYYYFAGSNEFMYIARVGDCFLEAVESYFNNQYLDKSRFPNLYSKE